MFEAGEIFALGLDAGRLRDCASMQHLHRDFLLEGAIRAHRFLHSHA